MTDRPDERPTNRPTDGHEGHRVVTVQLLKDKQQFQCHCRRDDGRMDKLICIESFTLTVLAYLLLN